LNNDYTCPVCDWLETSYQFHYKDAAILRCNGCGLSSRQPQISIGQADSVQATVADAPRLKKARLLEASLAGDILVNAAVKSGVLIISNQNEPQLVKELTGLNIEYTQQSEASFLTATDLGMVNCVILCSVIDTTTSPNALMEKVRSILVSGAPLLIVGTRFHSHRPQFGLNSSRNWQAELNFAFSRTTLQLLLEKHGFGEISLTSDGASSQFRPVIQAKVTGTSSNKRRLSIVMPVYNEKETFSKVLDLVLRKRVEGIDETEIIIVESNSSDGSREAVREEVALHPEIKVVFEDRPRGKGHAVREGFKHATGEIVLIQDADLEYDIDDYDALVQPLLAYRQCFVLGTRHSGDWKIRKFVGQEALATVLNFGHIFFRMIINQLYAQSLSDPFTMFKVLRRECLYNLYFECNRFDFDHELLIKLIKKGYTPIEIPINYNSRSFAEGKKVTFWKDPLTWLVADFKYLHANPFNTTSGSVVRERKPE
jgi:glycosyltransferase involved in cell wall biosynthesis